MFGLTELLLLLLDHLVLCLHSEWCPRFCAILSIEIGSNRPSEDYNGAPLLLCEECLFGASVVLDYPHMLKMIVVSMRRSLFDGGTFTFR